MLPQLDKTNFKIWSKQLEYILIANGLEHLLEKEYKEDKVITEDKRDQGKALYFLSSSLSHVKTHKLLVY